MTAIVVLIGAAILLAGAAAADPSQDDRFLALLAEQGIPAIKNTPTLIAVAHRVCRELDGGMRVDAVTDELTEKAFNAYPPERLFPRDRVTRTQNRFIIAAVQAYWGPVGIGVENSSGSPGAVGVRWVSLAQIRRFVR